MQNNQNENIENNQSNEQEGSAEERTEDLVSRQDLENVVDELKEKRKAAAEWKQKYEEAVSKGEKPEAEESKSSTVADEVEAVLKKRDLEAKSAERTSNLDKAINQFKASNPQLNDGEGERFKVIQSELDSFDLSDAHSVEDFSNFLRKSAVIAGVPVSKETPSESKTPSYTTTPGAGSSDTSYTDDTVRLTDAELAVVRSSKLTEERAIALKKSSPKTFANLIGR